MYLSYHSYSEKVVYPWSYTERPLPDWRELHHVAEVLASSMSQASGGRSKYKVSGARGTERGGIIPPWFPLGRFGARGAVHLQRGINRLGQRSGGRQVSRAPYVLLDGIQVS